MSSQNDNQGQMYRGMKWFVLLLLALAITAALYFRQQSAGNPLNLGGNSAESTAQVALTALKEAGPTQILLSGTASQTGTVQLFIDDQPVGMAKVAQNAWTTQLAKPEVGQRQLRLELIDLNGTVIGKNQHTIDVLAPVSAVPSQIDASGAQNARSVQPNSLAADAPISPTVPEATQVAPQVFGDLAPLTFKLHNDLPSFQGGSLILTGNGTPNSQVQVIIDNGNSPLILSAQTDDGGNWWAGQTVSQPGIYSVTVSMGGVSAEPLVLTVPAGVQFGSAENCAAGIAPWGVIEKQSYIVAPCETIAVVAQRLFIEESALLAANPTLDPTNGLTVGQRLEIPR